MASRQLLRPLAAASPTSGPALAAARTNRRVRPTVLPPAPDAQWIRAPAIAEAHPRFDDLLLTSGLGKESALGKTIVAKILHVDEHYLHLDIGAKFPAVVAKPPHLPAKNTPSGMEALVRLRSLELSQHFLGSTTHLTSFVPDVEYVRLLVRPRN